MRPISLIFFLNTFPIPTMILNSHLIYFLQTMIDIINLNYILNIYSIVSTELDVLNIITNIKLSTNTGTDGMPTIFLYNCRFIIIQILTNNFKISPNRGIFPSR